MKITVTVPTEITVAAIRCTVPIRYDLDEVGLTPDTFGITTIAGRTTLIWTLDIATRKVRDWPTGRTAGAFAKVVDEGTYELLAPDGNVVATRHQEPVPDCIPGEYGDYFAVAVAEDGTISKTGEGGLWRPNAGKIAESFFPG